MAATLDNQDYLAGDNMTVADITAFAGFLFADLIKLTFADMPERPLNWKARMQARESVIVALA